MEAAVGKELNFVEIRLRRDTSHTSSRSSRSVREFVLSGPTNHLSYNVPREYEMKLITQDRAKAGRAAVLLKQWGCCVYCTIRYLGDKQVDTYRKTTQELQEMIDDLISVMPDGNDIADNAESQPKNGEKLSCIACLGILEESFCSDSFITQVADVKQKDNHECDDFFISIKLPVSILPREHAIWLMLREQCKDIYYGLGLDDIAAIKEVWKWVNSPLLGRKLGLCFSMKSTFDICITFTHSNVDRECRFLLDCFPNVFKRRKNNRTGWETFTRTNVSKAIKDMSEAKFKKYYQCPPNRTYLVCECKQIVCTNEAIFMAGRYNKFCRQLPQSPWILDGVRKADSSIQELICESVVDVIGSSDYRFSASGREDVDVRMLGNGRPFVIELVNPHRIRLSREELAKLQRKINESTKRVSIRDLQIVTREDTATLKEGEENKTKSYNALCCTNTDIDEAKLAELFKIKDLLILQQTPIRVLHRRAVATRERTIHKMSASQLDARHFWLTMCTQAGTYVKEFVHGDLGRTSPNLGELLRDECDILELDVNAIMLDWPPSVDYSDVKT